MRNRLSILFVLLLFAILPLSALAENQVEIFSPQGTVKNVRQVTVRFSNPMVAFGDPRLSDPFEITCPEAGKGRWIDSRNWSYDFDRNLPAGVKCEFRVKSGLKSVAGASLAGQSVFAFSTGGPAIRHANPREGHEGIDEKQVFVLYLDSATDESSILKHLYFSVDGIKDRIDARILSDKERAAILKSIGERGKNEHIVVVQAKQTFPANSKIILVWEAGIKSKSGITSEKDQILSYQVRGPFTAEFSCAREKADAACIPILPVQLYFSAPIAGKTAQQIVLKSKAGNIWRPKKASEDADDTKFVRQVIFEGPFPEKSSFQILLPKDIKDDAGRSLDNQNKFPLSISTDAYPPLAKFSSRFGIIEAKGDNLLPVTIRNIEADIRNRLLKVGTDLSTGSTKGMPKSPEGIGQKLNGKMHKLGTAQEENMIRWLNRVFAAERKKSIFKTDVEAKTFTLPKPNGPEAFEVMGIPLSGPGLYIVELESRILGNHLLEKPGPMYVPAAALVTNLATHFKWGRESSLVWVTTLDKGLPVNGAQVSLRACNGSLVWQGKTDKQGLAKIEKKLPSPEKIPTCSGHNHAEYDYLFVQDGLFVFAKTKDDMTFSHSRWNQGIEPWRFQLPEGDDSDENNIITHTVFDRKLLRAGETAHMKHFIRNHTTRGFSFVPSTRHPQEMIIEHRGSQQQYKLPLTWNSNGTAENRWKIPVDARLGTYDVTLTFKPANKKKEQSSERGMHSGFFHVEEFRVPLMKGIIQPLSEPLIKASEATVDVSVSYLSGGGAANLPVKLRGELHDKSISFTGFEDYIFTGRRLQEGVIRHSRYGGAEDPDGEESPSSSADASNIKSYRFPTQEIKLNQMGVARLKFVKIPGIDTPKYIHAELEYRDPNGEVQTAVSNISLYPANRLIGISPDSWALSKEALKYKVVVVDLKGKPVPDAEVTIDLYQEKYNSHRVRLVGGFYSYRSSTEIKKIGRHFTGKTNKQGILFCEGKSLLSGNIIIHAEVKDDSGNIASANHSAWVAGKEEWWFEARNDDRIDLLPEKKRYEPGDTARFQVRMPFREATALVTVEREGVIDVYIKKLSGKMPVVEIPVKDNYAPNVYVSALVIRGRVGNTKPTATFDPGKPAYKLGIAEINVGWKAHQLRVQVIPEKSVFKVREIMNVRLKVKQASGAPPPQKSEVAIAAVDKGLLLMMPNNSWQLLEAMMKRRGYEVKTSTAQAMVVGKRHFGLKAVAHGGGGGKQLTRELFDTLLLWKGRVTLDDKGEASIAIPLNDSLTGFKIVAIASGESGFFGTGDADVRTTQDMMIMSGVPQLVREGDKFNALFTLRNTSERKMDVELKFAFSDIKGKTRFDTIKKTVEAGSAKEIGWTVKVPYGVDKIDYELAAQEINGNAKDQIRISQKVTKAIPVRTFQASLAQIRDQITIPVEKPADALPGRGGINIQLKPNITAGLSGVKEYMEQYPYTCLEQTISRAVALRDKPMFNTIVRKMPAYLDTDGLLKYFPSMNYGSDTLTSYILSVTKEAEYNIPDHLSDKLIRGLKNFVEGRISRHGTLRTADLAVRKLAAVEAICRYQKIEPSLLGSISIEPQLWPTSAVTDWISILQRTPTIPQHDRKLTEAQHILRSRMNMQGTTMGFSTERMDSLWWLMVSPDVNSVKALLTVLPFDKWNEDSPRIARGALGRMRRGHWDTTTANAWGVLAMEKFARKFESTPVTGKTTATMKPQGKSQDWSKKPRGATISLQWPKGKGTLNIKQMGTGSPWVMIQSQAAIPLKRPFSSGYKINKTLLPVEQKIKGQWQRGDVVRVRLDMEAQADMTWVVVNDPIPAGSNILRADMGGGSSILTGNEKRSGYAWEAYTEKSFEAFRVYYEYVPKGKWSIEYTLRLNNEGVFSMPSTRVEALYAPEILGEIPNRSIQVNEK